VTGSAAAKAADLAAAQAASLAAEIAALPKRDTPSVRAVRRRWTAALKSAPSDEVLQLAAAFELQAGQGGKWVAYELIRFHPGAFAATGEAQVADFAGRAQSWGAVDAFGTILAGPLWAWGAVSDAVIRGWAGSPDRWLRRLALVASVGGRIEARRTLELARRLADDRDDMVEKALSWALRALAMQDRPAVEQFMAEFEPRLAARVKREVRNKLATGLKSGRTRASAGAPAERRRPPADAAAAIRRDRN
jgi:3-methyladenine DNA glycosylase AlkD